MDNFLKLTLFKFDVFIIFKTLICGIAIFFIGSGGEIKKGNLVLWVALFLLMVAYDIKFICSNYPKHLFLKNNLGQAYEDVLHQNIEKSGAIELFYTNWFIEYWETYTSERAASHN